MVSVEQDFRLNMNRPITCAFTGHRPHKLPDMFGTGGRLAPPVAKRLDEAVRGAVSVGYKFFMSGGGLGFDLDAAECVVNVQKAYPFIKLVLALPCRGHTAKWPRESRGRFDALLASAADIIYVSDSEYSKGCMSKRNMFLVDHSSMIISAFADVAGGTMQTLNYAKKANVEIISLI